jgi:hypothetical protein
MFLTAPFGDSICSSVANTSDIRGLTLASVLRHCKARLAAMKAPFWGYCPPNLVSIIRNNFLLSPRYGFTQSTRFCSTPTLDLSTARRPDRNSSNTTPKLYTSLLAVNRPVQKWKLCYTQTWHRNSLSKKYLKTCMYKISSKWTLKMLTIDTLMLDNEIQPFSTTMFKWSSALL